MVSCNEFPLSCWVQKAFYLGEGGEGGGGYETSMFGHSGFKLYFIYKFPRELSYYKLNCLNNPMDQINFKLNGKKFQ